MGIGLVNQLRHFFTIGTKTRLLIYKLVIAIMMAWMFACFIVCIINGQDEVKIIYYQMKIKYIFNLSHNIQYDRLVYYGLLRTDSLINNNAQTLCTISCVKPTLIVSHSCKDIDISIHLTLPTSFSMGHRRIGYLVTRLAFANYNTLPKYLHGAFHSFLC